MTSPVSTASQDAETAKENRSLTTLHRIYRGDEELILRDPANRRSFINRSAYVKLHRSSSSGTKRHSVDNLKGRFEDLARQNSQEPAEGKKEQVPEEKPEVFTPATFGYPNTSKLNPPLIKPKIKPKPPVRKGKDENSNVVVRKNSESSDAEEIRIVLQASASEESVDRIAKELSNFEMDGKLNRKRPGSVRKFFRFFGKDKKKKEEEKKQKSEVVNDNIKNESSFNRQPPNVKNESNFNRQSPNIKNEPNFNRQSPSINNEPNFNRQSPHRQALPKLQDIINQEMHDEKIRVIEEEYARLHVNRFNQIRQGFNEDKPDNYVLLDTAKPSIDMYTSAPVNKYIDTSSSASTEPEKPNGYVRDTPPRAQEVNQSIRVVNPKASLPINTERSLPNPYQQEKTSPRIIEMNPKAVNAELPLPNPYQHDQTSPRTIERNLNTSNSKDYPDKANFTPQTSFEGRNGDVPKGVNAKPPLSPAKLKLPQNRDIYEPQPRVKSPIPINRVSTEKIIATELLKNTRSPTPPKRTEVRPPIAPPKPEVQVVTNALVHAPRRAETPLESRTYINVVPNARATTPVNLRMAVSAKISPQKDDIRKSVEEYYWKELKKLKEEEDSRLYFLQVNEYYEDNARLKRSRSLSPHRAGRRTLSLPREGGRMNYPPPPQQAIPEDQTVIYQQQNFVRNNQERRSVDSLQRPIFRRGSLTKQEIYESPQYNKKVSFSNSQRAWPTKSGYVQSPPQRRLERIDSELDDEVFVPNVDPIYGTRYVNFTEPLYGNRVLEQFRTQQYPRQVVPPQQMGTRRLSVDSIPRQDIYGSARRPVSNDYSRAPQQYPQSVYSSRQSMTDSTYGQRQVTVNSKFCDIYGQIHEAPRTGVVMGQLQNSPTGPHRQPDNFTRGSRLTASANDIARRYANDNGNVKRYDKSNFAMNYENRPLPPPPPPRSVQISDTESGSDASEIQRIMQNKTKSKRRGLFGK